MSDPLLHHRSNAGAPLAAVEDAVMAAAGDPDIWERMVEAALNVERAAASA